MASAAPLEANLASAYSLEASQEEDEESEEDESNNTQEQVPLEQFAPDEQFSVTLELLQLPPEERSRENVGYKLVECIFQLVKDNKFFSELEAEMSLELSDNWYLILSGSAGVYIEEIKDSIAETEQGGPNSKKTQPGTGKEEASKIGRPGALGSDLVGEISKYRRVDKNSCVANLAEGHSFGELGLIRNDVRSAALLTHSDCLFLTLDKKSFQHCLGNFLKQKSDDKVQTLRQVLPGAKELRKLVVEQLTYFFKEATIQKDMALSTEGNKEDTLYLIVKGHAVERALSGQKDKSGGTADRPETAGACGGLFGPSGQRAQNLSSVHGGNNVGSSTVLLEELDLALLQEGCLAMQGTRDFTTAENFGGREGEIESCHTVLPLTFSPFLSKRMRDYINASALSLEDNTTPRSRVAREQGGDGWGGEGRRHQTAPTESTHPHTAVLNHGTVRQLKQQQQRRTHRYQSLQSAADRDTVELPPEVPQSIRPRLETPVVFQDPDSTLSDSAHCPIRAQKQTHKLPDPAWPPVGASTTESVATQLGRLSNRGIRSYAERSKVHPEEGSSRSCSSMDPLSSSKPLRQKTSDNRSGNGTAEGTPRSATICAQTVATVFGSHEAFEDTKTSLSIEAIAAREAAAYASSALSLGHPIVSDSALEFFFRNISRDAVNINNKFCCQCQREAQAAFQRFPNAQATSIAEAHTPWRRMGKKTDRGQMAKADKRRRAPYLPSSAYQAQEANALIPKDVAADGAKQGSVSTSQASKGAITMYSGSVNQHPTIEAYERSGQHPAMPHLVASSRQRCFTPAPEGAFMAKELREAPLPQRQQEYHHHQQLLARSLETPYLHLLLQTPELIKQMLNIKAHHHALRQIPQRLLFFLSYSLQVYSATLGRCLCKPHTKTSPVFELPADISLAPRGASCCTGRRMLAQQVAVRLETQHIDGA
ncbi:cyclic nucleotide-binding domain-containing protein [Cyclospora cayetanensis]|uniref:Cyclic nucleotide-binding domain-containing protein n=1 Tax=Cyclospora cayetanensis TaxID=88456 RepID=A0A1D3CWU1_9EIME|nr:cyclic nucleotide-binding domain-containing protein [Cyclospora cayetanensis]